MLLIIADKRETSFYSPGPWQSMGKPIIISIKRSVHFAVCVHVCGMYLDQIIVFHHGDPGQKKKHESNNFWDFTLYTWGMEK